MPKHPSKPQKKLQKKSPVPPPGSSQIRRAEDLLDREQYAEAALVALEASDRYPTLPEFPELAVRALLGLGEIQRALIPLRRLLTLHPNRVRSLHLGAVAYASNEMYAHAVRCFRRIMELEPLHPSTDRLKSIIGKGEEIIKTSAASLKVDFETAEEGQFWQEEGNLRRYAGEILEAIGALRRSVEVLPDALNPHLLLSDALFLSGRLDESESLCRKALELEPDIIEAQVRLLLIARARYDEAGMDAAYALLRDREPGDSLADRSALTKAHGLMGEHERAYAIAHRIGQDHTTLPSYTLPVLGAAAANTGHLQEAKGFYRLTQNPNDPPSPELTALEIGLPGPTLSPSFPYVGIPELISLSLFEEIASLFSPDTEGYESATAEDRAAALDRFPQLLWVGEKFLYEEDLDIGLSILLTLSADRGAVIVRHLVSGQDQPWSARVKAVTALLDHDLWGDGEILRLWYEDRWVEVTPEQVNGLFDKGDFPDELLDGIMEAIEHQDANRKRSERVLRHLLERFPDHPIVYHNLALLSDREDAESLLRRALEIEPGYIYARTTLAILLAGERKVDEAVALLDEIPSDRLLSPEEYVTSLYARAHIERVRGRLDAAIDLLSRLLKEDPEHPSALSLLNQLRDAKKKGPLLLDERGYWMEEGPLLSDPFTQIRRGQS